MNNTFNEITMNDINRNQGLKKHRSKTTMLLHLLPAGALTIMAIASLNLGKTHLKHFPSWAIQSIAPKFITFTSYMSLALLIGAIIIIILLGCSILDIVISHQMFDERPINALVDAHRKLSELPFENLKTQQQREVKYLREYIKNFNAYWEKTNRVDIVMRDQVEADRIITTTTSESTDTVCS